MPDLPLRVASLPRSGIRAIMDLASTTPEPVLHLEVGQPDSPPPDHVLAAMAEAIERKDAGYTPNGGIPELRQECSAKLARVNGILRPADQVVVSAGSMQGLAAAVVGLTEPGDEVLVPDPGWPNYAMIARLSGLRAVPYPLHLDNRYYPDFGEVESLVGDRTSLVIVNSPSNPLGVVWDRETMHKWLRLAEHHDLWLLSDECYDEIFFDADVVSPAALTGGDERAVTVHSFSKSYAMTGLRIGYVSGPAQVTDALVTMQEALVACVNGPAQHGALAALRGPQDFVREMRDLYRHRRDRAMAVCRELKLPYVIPQGAFYLWLPLQGRINDTMAFCRRLVAERHVAVAPGETFGARGTAAIRVSLASSEDTIVAGLQRIAAAIG